MTTLKGLEEAEEECLQVQDVGVIDVHSRVQKWAALATSIHLRGVRPGILSNTERARELLEPCYACLVP